MDYEFLKTIAQILSLLSLPIAVVAYIRSRYSQSLERTHKLTDRIYELDKLVIQYPKLQEILYQNVNQTGHYFISSNPHNQEYFQLKSFVYYHLNFFDEIFTIAADDHYLAKHLELSDWNGYIILKMRHPLFKELFEKEASNFGEHFRSFVRDKKEELRKPADPEAY